MGINDRIEKDGRKRKQQAPPEVSYDAPFVGYINLQLTEEEKASYERWSQSSSYWEAIETFTADGVNISLKVDVRSGGFLASGTQRRVNSPNAGLVVTARSRSAATALGRLMFSLVVLSRHERWTERQPVADPDRW